jgi:nitrite reductase/ring-hydroxylating ferredoxin subunit
MDVIAGNLKDFEEGKLLPVWVGQHCVAVGRIQGQLRAFLSECPHRGAQLIQGSLNGTVLTCPWHSWEFDVLSGKGLTNPHAQLTMLAATIGDDGTVTVTVPDHWA